MQFGRGMVPVGQARVDNPLYRYDIIEMSRQQERRRQETARARSFLERRLQDVRDKLGLNKAAQPLPGETTYVETEIGRAPGELPSASPFESSGPGKFRVICYDETHWTVEEFTELDSVGRFAGRPGMVWVQVLGITDPQVVHIVGTLFEVPVLAQEDILTNTSRPKFEEHGDKILAIARAVRIGVEEDTPRGPKKKITAFFVDKGTKGFNVRDGYRNVSHRGYTNAVLEFDDCRLNKRQILGEVHKGFEVANSWLGATRLQVASTCLGRAERAMGHALSYAAERKQFGQQIGKFQGVSFKLADMQTRLDAAELLTLRAAWNDAHGKFDDAEMAMAKVFASEMCQFVTDEAIQIFGGMGLMDELPLERMWRDTRVDRIWDGTSEIQRHIISRQLLRKYGG